MKKRSLLFCAAIMLLFLLSLSLLEEARESDGRQQLETALRRAAVSCYALEGAYPASVDHLCRVYGLQWDESRYEIAYVLTASNLMPDITVLEK